MCLKLSSAELDGAGFFFLLLLLYLSPLLSLLPEKAIFLSLPFLVFLLSPLLLSPLSLDSSELEDDGDEGSLD